MILPDRAMPATKLLLPQRRLEWDQPSARLSTFGERNQTKFCLSARLTDGFLVWRGWFEDREDVDAFLWALASGTLRFERALWDLPTPSCCPGLGEAISYCLATVTFVASGTTFSIPSDWTSSNIIETIGAGGNGGAGAAN